MLGKEKDAQLTYLLREVVANLEIERDELTSECDYTEADDYEELYNRRIADVEGVLNMLHPG